MSKRTKYFLLSMAIALIFLIYISLTYEMRYYGLALTLITTGLAFWFGLGSLRWQSILLPVTFVLGYGLFTALLPYSIILALILAGFLGIICYVIFLVENVFMVAIGYKTVPLYRAAYTVSLMILLLSAFFMFDSLLSFGLQYYWNLIGAMIISVMIFWYQFWAITIELADDGAKKDWMAYVLVPSWIVAQLMMVFSFWPVGIFKGSIYLVSIIYILSGLVQSDIRERLFKRTWMSFVWISLAIVLAIMLMTEWR